MKKRSLLVVLIITSLMFFAAGNLFASGQQDGEVVKVGFIGSLTALLKRFSNTDYVISIIDNQ